MTIDAAKPLNEDRAEASIDAIRDEPTQNLVRMAVATARMELIRQVGQTETEWRAQVPAAPLDMDFFVRVLAKTLSRPDVVRRVLDGASIAEATGWDEE